jgi:hypothetical protein
LVPSGAAGGAPPRSDNRVSEPGTMCAMGSIYAVLSLFGLVFIGLAMLIFYLEGGEHKRMYAMGCLTVFAAAAWVLWIIVRAILSSET